MHNYNEYWRSVRDDVEASDADWQRLPQGRQIGAHGLKWRLDWIRFSSVDDTLIWGWYCVPDDHPIDRNAVLWLLDTRMEPPRPTTIRSRRAPAS